MVLTSTAIDDLEQDSAGHILLTQVSRSETWYLPLPLMEPWKADRL